jgi:hypothetical protein
MRIASVKVGEGWETLSSTTLAVSLAWAITLRGLAAVEAEHDGKG